MCKKKIGLQQALVSIIFLLLSACATVTKDGPPSYSVNAANIPDATPKIEPRSKYGNPAVYRVFGKQYHVLRSSKNYEEQGIASWYGTKFHSQRTSSGERYNMLGMTAAHKSLPLPTYVQVTNLANGKTVIVKVNDRGPFEANRLIDLSYVAAKKLGMLGHGTARVNVKAIDPLLYGKKNNTTHATYCENEPRPSLLAKQQHSGVYLQVGAFKNKILAEQFKKRLIPLVSSPIKITYFMHRKKLYRVQIGPIKDVATANHLSKKLNTIGLQSKKMIMVS